MTIAATNWTMSKFVLVLRASAMTCSTSGKVDLVFIVGGSCHIRKRWRRGSKLGWR